MESKQIKKDVQVWKKAKRAKSEVKKQRFRMRKPEKKKEA